MNPTAESDPTPQQLRMAIDVARVGLWRLDLDTERVQINQHLWDMLGLPPRPEGMPLAELRALIHPDDLPQVVAEGDHALQIGTSVDTQARYRHSDGRWRHLLSRRVVQHDAEGRPRALLGVTLDLTERTQILQQAQQAQQAAEREAQAARQQQLQSQAQREAHAQLLARASHELRTPLNAVLGMARLLLERPDAPLDQRQRQARHVVAAGEHLLALVNDLLEQSDALAGPVRTVPLAAPAPEAAWSPEIGALPAVPVVLYIEDNPVNALIVRELVDRRGGLDLHVATDGASGLASAREQPPALVLMDMQLPDMDGLAVLAQLRADPRTAGAPCVAVSANAVPEDIQRALQAGFADYWTKPLDFRGFLASLDRWFGPPPAA